MPGDQQLSFLEVGEDNSELEQEKFKSINMVKQKDAVGVFKYG